MLVVKGGGELGFEREGGEGEGVFEDMPRLLNILVMVGWDGGRRGRATVETPQLLKIYYNVGGGGVRATV
jgi:hypothetical protein